MKFQSRRKETQRTPRAAAHRGNARNRACGGSKRPRKNRDESRAALAVYNYTRGAVYIGGRRDPARSGWGGTRVRACAWQVGNYERLCASSSRAWRCRFLSIINEARLFLWGICKIVFIGKSLMDYEILLWGIKSRQCTLGKHLILKRVKNIKEIKYSENICTCYEMESTMYDRKLYKEVIETGNTVEKLKTVSEIVYYF